MTGDRGQCQGAAHPRSPPGVPAEPHSALGNARHGATGRGDNNRERIWVRALAALCGALAGPGAAAGAAGSRHFHVQRVGRGWAAMPGNGGPALSRSGRGALVSEPLPGSGCGDKGVTRQESFPQDG